jgi:hypothetical protein
MGRAYRDRARVKVGVYDGERERKKDSFSWQTLFQ